MAVANPHPRILVLRDLKLGDFLTAVPALHALRRHDTEAFLVLVAPQWLAPLATSIGVDALIARSELKCYRDEVDVAINLHGSGPQSTRTLMSLRARRTIAFRHRNVPAVDGPAWDDDEHEVTRWCRLVASAGVLADRDELGVPVPDVTALVAPGGVIVHPGASAPARRWPVERFARVARHVHESGHRVVLTGSADEREIANRVARRAGIPVDMLAGETTLAELCVTVAHAAAVLSNDTGVAHLATAYGVPSVVLFGPTPPSRWGPPLHSPHRAIWKGGTGDPHGRVVDPALDRIETAEVVDALDEVLSRPGVAQRRNDRGTTALGAGAERMRAW
jgi:ADP-heptose:LPS heptosyltransferase